MIALVLEQELVQLGHHVCGLVPTGEQAVEAAAREKPDLILMDMGLAGIMDGLEATRQIHARQAIPVVFMTGYTDEVMKQHLESVAALACLTKPIQIYQIQEAIESINSAGGKHNDA